MDEWDGAEAIDSLDDAEYEISQLRRDLDEALAELDRLRSVVGEEDYAIITTILEKHDNAYSPGNTPNDAART